MANNRIITVGEFCPFTYGKGLSAVNRNAFGIIPVYGSNGVVGFHDQALTKGPTVIIGRKGTVGAIQFSPVPCWPIDTTFFITDDEPLLLRFKYYLLKSIGLEQMDTDTAVPGLNRDSAHARTFRLPIKDEQRAIAHILGTLDDKIELNRKMNETLEAMAKAIFKSWFIDFDPVHAKAEGCDPGLPKEIADLFPSEFQDYELGQIPKGWRVGTVGDEFNLTMGQSPPGETYNEVGEGMPFFQGRTDFEFRYPTRRIYCTVPTRVANVGDTLVSVRAPVGDINMAREACCVGRGVAAIRHKSGSRSYTFYTMRMLSDVFSNFESEGTVFGSINKDDFKNIKHIIPAPQLMDKFEKIVFSLDQSIENNTLQSTSLAAIRDTLLPKLLSGEIRVKDAERFMEETVDTVQTEKIIPLRLKKTREATPEFKEAVLIATLVRSLATKEYPLGRFRYTKMSYFVHRKAKHSVAKQYLKKAAGPYNPQTRYKGPEDIAIRNRYVINHKHGKRSGFIVGDKINDIDKYLDGFSYHSVVKWVIDNFRYKSNEYLELLSTVDLAVLELKMNSKTVTVDSIRRFISNEKEWQNKLKRNLFSSKNIQRALDDMEGFFLNEA